MTGIQIHYKRGRSKKTQTTSSSWTRVVKIPLAMPSIKDRLVALEKSAASTSAEMLRNALSPSAEVKGSLAII